MRFHPGIDARMARALPWLVALTALSLFGISLARAEAPSRPPVSPAAVKQATGQADAPKAPEQKVTEQKATDQKTPVAEQKAVQSKSAEPKAAVEKSAAPKVAAQKSAPADTNMTLRGGQERTDFRTMTIEGEDRVHLEVERPPLTLDLDPEKVGGLESGTASDVLNRVAPDLVSAYLQFTSHGPTPYLAHPWLRQFTTGSIARFEPNVKGVERWKLVVADSKGQTVTTFQGKGDPPKEIVWDGRSQDGSTVTPGLTYSYIFEAYDRAGNKRNFVGKGFRVSAYRLDSPDGPMLVFSGQSLIAAQKSARGTGMGPDVTAKAVPPVILEAAGWLNQGARQSQPVRVTATGRSYEQANLLAGRVSAALAELALGDPARIQTVAEVLPDAPDGGTIRISSTPLNLQEIRSNPKAR
jgi:hypothetical protein